MNSAIEIIKATKKAPPEIQNEVYAALLTIENTPTTMYDKIELKMQTRCRERKVTASHHEMNNLTEAALNV